MAARGKQIIVGIAAALLLVAGGFSYNYSRHKSVPSKSAQTTVTNRYSVKYTATAGKTALAQLQSIAKVTTKQSSYGTLVDGINGITNGSEGKYWVYTIDGKFASVGADAYVAKGGEKIEWKFSKE